MDSRLIPKAHAVTDRFCEQGEPKPPAAPVIKRRRNNRAQVTIRKLLGATSDELCESPYADLTVRAVAARAGVSPASAYKYFPPKNALVADVHFRQPQDVPMSIDVNQPVCERVRATSRGWRSSSLTTLRWLPHARAR